MRPAPRSRREVALPASSFAALRRSLREEAGEPAATQGLYAAGFGAGEAMYASFAEGLDTPPPELGEAAFWRALGAFLAQRGWGSLELERIHPGVGLIKSADWAEADPGSDEPQAVCAFSSGLFATLLGRLAGDSVAVLEVGCRSGGEHECRFAFGSEPTIQRLYELLLEGHDLAGALAEL